MQSYWIWSFGDYEVFHTNLVNSRRQQYGMDYPVFWRIFSVDQKVVFRCDREIEKDGIAKLHLNGFGYFKIDDKMYGDQKTVPIPKGNHRFEIHIMNLKGLPAAYLESDVLPTDGGWYTLGGKRERIPVGCDKKYSKPSDNPEMFPFSYKTFEPISEKSVNGGVLYEFERELYGYLNIEGLDPKTEVHISYGESVEEALDTEWAVVQENIVGSADYKLRQRAFRYIFITGGMPLRVYAELEYQELTNRAEFRCDREDVNKIWEICAYTLQINMREVLTEAVKRDRWLWGGDAYQAFKFVKYLCSNTGTVRRSLIGMRGKEPLVEHINTITDYSLYWVIGMLEYYENYGDAELLRLMYPRIESLMDFCEGREDENGFIVGKYGDWIFIDWSKIDKTGAVCAEQMLYIAANRAMARISEVCGHDGAKYTAKAEELTEKVNEFYWNGEKGAFIDSFQSGKNNVTRHANIFAIMYGIATDEQRDSIVENVLKNNEIIKITTPYFEGYELDVMGKIGDIDYIYDMITSYWKGMLDLGATTVWEEYDPKLSGTEHYAMYGDKFQKSLCHAWGASPIYLLGKYFLGVTGESAGYEEFAVRPRLGKFKFIDGTVPIGDGKVKVYLSESKLSVMSTVPGGTLYWQEKEYRLEPNCEVCLEF